MTLSDRDLAKIRAAIAEQERARQRIEKHVHRVRGLGATWTDVGYALGITAQGAQKRYGSSSERVEAHRASAAKKAAKRAQKGATRPESADPWPDGTVQERLT